MMQSVDFIQTIIPRSLFAGPLDPGATHEGGAYVKSNPHAQSIGATGRDDPVLGAMDGFKDRNASLAEDSVPPLSIMEPRQDSLDRSSNSASAPSTASALTMAAKLRVDFSQIQFNKIIGKGSFKTVYRGRWNNTAVAIVSMRKGGMLTEARVLQRLGNHPNLVQFYRWSADDKGNEYMLLELVQLGSLDKLLLAYGHMIRTRAKLMMCEQICSAMGELIEEGVLHRDLAARNILVQSMDPVHIKVTDFGLARMGPAGSTQDGQLLNSTASMSVPVRWIPPEVLTSGAWSEKSDVWSFGVTMWEIFSDGAEPYARKSDEEVVKCIQAGELLSKPPRCPRELYKLMQQCWAPSPADRPTFATIAGVFRRWREAWVAQHGSGSVGGPVDDSGMLPSIFSPSGHLPALSGRLPSTNSGMPQFDSAHGHSASRTSSHRRHTRLNSDKSRGRPSVDGNPALTATEHSARLMQCVDAVLGVPFSASISTHRPPSSGHTSHTGSGGSVAVVPGVGMRKSPVPASPLADSLLPSALMGARVSFAHEEEDADLPRSNTVSASTHTGTQPTTSSARLEQLAPHFVSGASAQRRPHSGRSNGHEVQEAGFGGGVEQSGGLLEQQDALQESMHSRQSARHSEGGSTSTGYASHLSTSDPLTLNEAVERGDLQRSGTEAFNALMMDELHGGPLVLEPPRVLPWNVAGGVLAAELNTHTSVNMSFDMETAIEPCMSYSTLNTMTQNIAAFTGVDMPRETSGTSTAVPHLLRAAFGSGGSSTHGASPVAGHTPLGRSLSALGPRPLRPPGHATGASCTGRALSEGLEATQASPVMQGPAGSAVMASACAVAHGPLRTIPELPAPSSTPALQPSPQFRVLRKSSLPGARSVWPGDVVAEQQQPAQRQPSVPEPLTQAQGSKVVGDAPTPQRVAAELAAHSAAHMQALKKGGAGPDDGLVAGAGEAAAAGGELQPSVLVRDATQEAPSKVGAAAIASAQVHVGAAAGVATCIAAQQQQQAQTCRSSEVEPQSLEPTPFSSMDGDSLEATKQRLAMLQQACGTDVRDRRARSKTERRGGSATTLPQMQPEGGPQEHASPGDRRHTCNLLRPASRSPAPVSGPGSATGQSASPRATGIKEREEQQQQYPPAVLNYQPQLPAGTPQVPDWVRPDLVARSRVQAARDRALVMQASAPAPTSAPHGVQGSVHGGVSGLQAHSSLPLPAEAATNSISDTNAHAVHGGGAASGHTSGVAGRGLAGVGGVMLDLPACYNSASGAHPVHDPLSTATASGAQGGLQYDGSGPLLPSSHGTEVQPSAWAGNLPPWAVYSSSALGLMGQEGGSLHGGGAGTALSPAVVAQLQRVGPGMGMCGVQAPAGGAGYLPIKQLHVLSGSGTAPNSAQLPQPVQAAGIGAPAAGSGYLSIKHLQAHP